MIKLHSITSYSTDYFKLIVPRGSALKELNTPTKSKCYLRSNCGATPYNTINFKKMPQYFYQTQKKVNYHAKTTSLLTLPLSTHSFICTMKLTFTSLIKNTQYAGVIHSHNIWELFTHPMWTQLLFNSHPIKSDKYLLAPLK